MPTVQVIPYNDLGALEAKLEADPNIVAFMVEPIQVSKQPGHPFRTPVMHCQMSTCVSCDVLWSGIGLLPAQCTAEHISTGAWTPLPVRIAVGRAVL